MSDKSQIGNINWIDASIKRFKVRQENMNNGKISYQDLTEEVEQVFIEGNLIEGAYCACKCKNGTFLMGQLLLSENTVTCWANFDTIEKLEEDL